MYNFVLPILDFTLEIIHVLSVLSNALVNLVVKQSLKLAFVYISRLEASFQLTF